MLNHCNLLGSLGIVLTSLFSVSCVFKFDVPSEKTELEQQVLGKWELTDEELLLISTTRSADSTKLSINTPDLAMKNRIFNRDDIMDYRQKGFIGEGREGYVVVLPPKYHTSNYSKESKILNIVVAEENRDRKIIWRNAIEDSKIDEIQSLKLATDSFRKETLNSLNQGDWYQSAEDKWIQK